MRWEQQQWTHRTRHIQQFIELTPSCDEMGLLLAAAGMTTGRLGGPRSRDEGWVGGGIIGR